MSYCSKIRSIIDEVDRPDVLPFEAVDHLATCQGCQIFASDRTSLRTLLASDTRVTVPVNFNAVLTQRLTEIKAPKSFWFSAAGFVRLGGATAALAVALLAAQYGGLFGGPSSPPAGPQASVPGSEMPAPAVVTPQAPPAASSGGQLATATIPDAEPPAERRSQGRGRGTRPPSSTEPGTARDSGGVTNFLVRDQGREVAVPMMTVSLGMQQQVLNSSARQQPRSADISY
jgi:hypothetical protein